MGGIAAQYLQKFRGKDLLNRVMRNGMLCLPLRHYVIQDESAMIRRIFLPSGKTCLARGPYILIFLLLHILFLMVAFNVAELPVLPLVCFLLYTYLKLNINAQRCRDSGAKGRYVVIFSLLVYLASLAVAATGVVSDVECVSLGIRIYFGYDVLVFFVFMLAPTQLKQQINSTDHVSISGGENE
ncbi:hypothetical protein [Kosakonia sacchari]|uniref:DUF805 domain-containing protein n=1 Tax=Kosakonia sacchari TaxID=1158459 RepID=A0ABZ0MP87_9ENTR|nr:hypothetical protein [Kosakonia sacchari]WOZ77308.1 hypothetical protein Q8Y70_22595 [Kosakonia sacchari]